MKITQTKINLSLYYLIGTIVLLWPAFYNGFPLLYSDVGTYIFSGFELWLPADRPITYGLLIRLFSLNGVFIWGMLCFQAICLLWIIQLFSRTFFSVINPLRLLFIIVLLSVLSPLGWRTSELMPDILSPVCLLLILILVLRYNAISEREKVVGWVIYFVFNALHLSHFMLHLIILFFVLIIWLLGKRKITFSLSNWLILFLMTFNILLISNNAITQSKAVFQMGALAENGVLYQFLSDQCSTHNYALCSFAEKVKTIDGGDFIWPENGPVSVTDGWGKGRKEYNEIIERIFTEPKYLKIFLKNSLRRSAMQFCTFEIGDGNTSFQMGTPAYDAISKHMPSQLPVYKNSREYKDTLQNVFPFWRSVFRIIFWLSFILLPIVLYLSGKGKTLLVASLLIVFTLIVNAWTSTSFACLSSRYQSKYAWLVPLLVILIANDKWFKTKKV